MKAFGVLVCWMIVMFTGCSSSVRILVERAPELHLKGVKTIKVGHFPVNGTLNLDLVEEKGSVLGTISDIALDAGANKLAKKKHPEMSRRHQNGLKKAMRSHGFFKVTDRADFDALLSGSITYTVKDAGALKKDTSQKGQSREYYELTRSAETRVEITATDKKGNVLGTSQASARAWDKTRKDNRAAALIGTENWDKVVDRALTASHPAVLRRIAPYSVWETRVLEKGDSKAIKKGVKAARKGKWPEAAFLWESALKTGNREDKSAALYNLGIYDEAKGELHDALSKFEQALSISGRAQYANDIARLKARIEDDERMRGLE
ncbi:DUF6340 family protein [Fibrobacterota bacterium]